LVLGKLIYFESFRWTNKVDCLLSQNFLSIQMLIEKLSDNNNRVPTLDSLLAYC